MKHDTQFSLQSNEFAEKRLEINSVGFVVALQVIPVREVSQMLYSFGNERLCWEIKVCEAAGRNSAELVRPTGTERTIGMCYSKAMINFTFIFPAKTER